MYNRLSKDYKIKGVLLEKMVPKGIELIVGLQNDPQFGPVIMLGLGGIYTELFKDVSFRVLPISKQDALDMINDLRAKEILKGFRGSQKIKLDMLCDDIIKIGNLGFDLAKYINSVDFNPIIVYPDNYYVVDAKIILTSDTDKNIVSQSMPDSRYMDVFFNANSIALIGASPEEGKIGNSVLKSLSQYDYKGKIYPVNAKGYDKILGLKAYKNLEDINEKIDLVIVTVDLKFVPAILETCGKIGIHNMVIISGGGNESPQMFSQADGGATSVTLNKEKLVNLNPGITEVFADRFSTRQATEHTPAGGIVSAKFRAYTSFYYLR